MHGTKSLPIAHYVYYNNITRAYLTVATGDALQKNNTLSPLGWLNLSFYIVVIGSSWGENVKKFYFLASATMST